MLILALNVAAEIALALNFPHFPGAILASLDFLLAAGLLLLAVRYSSLWVGVAMLLQSVSLCSHAFVFDGLGLGPQQRVELNNAISLLMLGCVVVATIMSWRAKTQALSRGPGLAPPATV